MTNNGSCDVLDGIKDTRSKIFSNTVHGSYNKVEAKADNDDTYSNNGNGRYGDGRHDTAEGTSLSEMDSVTRIKREHKEKEKNLVSTCQYALDTLHSIILYQIMSCHDMSCHIIIISYHIMLCPVLSR